MFYTKSSVYLKFYEVVLNFKRNQIKVINVFWNYVRYANLYYLSIYVCIVYVYLSLKKLITKNKLYLKMYNYNNKGFSEYTVCSLRIFNFFYGLLKPLKICFSTRLVLLFTTIYLYNFVHYDTSTVSTIFIAF